MDVVTQQNINKFFMNSIWIKTIILQKYNYKKESVPLEQRPFNICRRGIEKKVQIQFLGKHNFGNVCVSSCALLFPSHSLGVFV